MHVLRFLRAAVVAAWLLFAGSGCSGRADGAPSSAEASAERPCVEVGEPVEREVPDVLELRVQLVAERASTLMSRQTGYVASVAVDAGDHVDQGDPLVLVSANELGHLVRATGAEVEAAAARIRRLEVERASARQEAERAEALQSSGGISAQQRDRLVAQEAAVEEALAEARAAQAGALGRLAQTRTMANERGILAPFDGVVTRRFVEVGELVSAFPPTPLLEVVDDSTVRAYVYVPQRHGVRVRVGAPIAVHCAGGEPLAGALTHVAADVDAATRTIAAYVSLPNAEHRLRHGEACVGRLELQRERRRLVPRDALVERSESRATVFHVASDDGIVRALPVRIGLLTDDGYPVLEGLPAGARVVVTGASTLRDGMRVRLAREGSCDSPPGSSRP